MAGVSDDAPHAQEPVKLCFCFGAFVLHTHLCMHSSSKRLFHSGGVYLAIWSINDKINVHAVSLTEDIRTSGALGLWSDNC